ncbi:HAD family acid phosphatase [Mesobacillus maritimus]|uniref:5' nucleotidase, NT5C type n=1 Tax=Mesobacillus maritimus TaxID=1643336 RepID=UPI00384DE1CD
MKFGFDIDDTLINLREHAFHLYNQKLNKNIDLKAFRELKRVEIHEPFGLTDEEGKHMWNSSLEDIYYTSCPSFTGAVELLNDLVDKGHEVYYITSRPKEHGERTMKWMLENGFPVQKERFFYGMKDSEKVDIIRNLKLDYYFDDKPEVLDTLSGESLRVYVKDQSYNQHIAIPRVKEWVDFTFED